MGKSGKIKSVKRQNQIRKGRIQAGLIFFAAAMALVAQLYSSNSSSYSERILEKAAAYYAEGEKQKAVDLIEAEPLQFVSVENGCELMIKLFDEAKKFDLLENASTRCLDAGKAVGIAHEGYAKSLLLQGRSLEAIMTLEKEAVVLNHPRVYGAIVSLYLNQKDFEGAGKNLLAAVKAADPWSPWVDRALSIKRVANNKKFISSLVEIVLKKPKTESGISSEAGEPSKVTPDCEEKLLKVAKSLGLENQANLLMKRRG